VQPAAGSTNPGGDGERHHAVIVFADVVAYSRLMADDEAAALSAHYAGDNMPEAVRWARLCGDENPGYTANLRYLIAALVLLASLAEARAIAGDLMREFQLATFARRRQPFRQPETGAA
jgi:class 3 adenylate cyclase